MRPTRPVLVLIGLASTGLILACNLTARLTPTVQILDESTSIPVTRTVTEPVTVEPIQSLSPSERPPSQPTLHPNRPKYNNLLGLSQLGLPYLIPAIG